ncbi:MAG: DUF4164 family protein [Pseudomonadota bacterium]|nr:DUF4164 family protein [Pseudomonadota bacterium]
MENSPIQSTSSMQSAKTKLEKAFDRLEKVIRERIESPEKTGEFGAELITLQNEIDELRKKNRIASNRIDATIKQIQKILGS